MTLVKNVPLVLWSLVLHHYTSHGINCFFINSFFYTIVLVHLKNIFFLFRKLIIFSCSLKYFLTSANNYRKIQLFLQVLRNRSNFFSNTNKKWTVKWRYTFWRLIYWFFTITEFKGFFCRVFKNWLFRNPSDQSE